MAALVRHFGDVEDASHPCGICDVCDPGGAVLRLFRRASAAEIEIAKRIVEELRGVDYKAAGTLQKNLDLVGRIGRDEYDNLLGAMVQASLIEIEDAEFEKDGQVLRYRKVRLTPRGLEIRPHSPLELLISDGIVDEFVGRAHIKPRDRKAKPLPSSERASGSKSVRPVPPEKLTAVEEALAVRLREWRASEAKRLKVPAYLVIHDRTLMAVAQARPKNPRELLAIDGIGPGKVERFGEQLLSLCAEM